MSVAKLELENLDLRCRVEYYEDLLDYLVDHIPNVSDVVDQFDNQEMGKS